MYGLILVAPSCMKGDVMNVRCDIPLPCLCWFGMEPREYLPAYVWLKWYLSSFYVVFFLCALKVCDAQPFIVCALLKTKQNRLLYICLFDL